MYPFSNPASPEWLLCIHVVFCGQEQHVEFLGCEFARLQYWTFLPQARKFCVSRKLDLLWGFCLGKCCFSRAKSLVGLC